MEKQHTACTAPAVRGSVRNAKTLRKDLENCVTECDMAARMSVKCLAAAAYFCDLLQYSEN